VDGGGKSRRQCVLDVPNQQPSCVCVCVYTTTPFSGSFVCVDFLRIIALHRTFWYR
jgi:hypothetical protein